MSERTRTDADALETLALLWKVLDEGADDLSDEGYLFVARTLRETGRDIGDWNE